MKCMYIKFWSNITRPTIMLFFQKENTQICHQVGQTSWSDRVGANTEKVHRIFPHHIWQHDQNRLLATKTGISTVCKFWKSEGKKASNLNFEILYYVFPTVIFEVLFRFDSIPDMIRALSFDKISQRNRG